MKVPLRFQNTEYDCGTTTFVNALSYLFSREEIPVTLLKKIYQYTLDVEGNTKIVGEGGTSIHATEKLTKYISRYANDNNFKIKCEVLLNEEVTIDKIIECINNNGVAIARCYMDGEHYVLITKIQDDLAYIFDPYYLPENYYKNDQDVKIVLYKDFAYNRLVSINRLFSTSKEDFSLMEINKREIILVKRT